MAEREFKRLVESISTTGVKIIELYNRIDNDLLNMQPDYQRKLVWKKQHKYAFVDTILRNFPFPEIYIASTDIDVEKMVASEVVVDGQQRLSTIVDYIKGEGDFESQKKVPSFDSLSTKDKKEFLNYKVSVKDLKTIGEDLIKEIFQRINSTEYSLNDVERNNALYGDGEIALFVKQVAENKVVSDEETDIIVSEDDRLLIYNFFRTNNVFTANDVKRMYDFQYFMLIISTILEGGYFGRSSQVDQYLEKYNSEFPQHELIIGKFKNSISIIEKLNFSEKSYWFNKANLFTLFVEFSNVQIEEISPSILERNLLLLEDKVDIYFTAEDEKEIEEITEDERKYFENARHGSHEKGAREHRGKVIREIIEESMVKHDSHGDEDRLKIEKTNFNLLKSKNFDFAILIPTKTGLTKSILDAVSEVRELFSKEGIHDYDKQELGPTNKVKLNSIFKGESDEEKEMSLYRSNGRGDYRLWFKDLSNFAEPNDKIGLIIKDGSVNVLNLTQIDYTDKLD